MLSTASASVVVRSQMARVQAVVPSVCCAPVSLQAAWLAAEALQHGLAMHTDVQQWTALPWDHARLVMSAMVLQTPR